MVFKCPNIKKGINGHSRDIISKDKWVQLKGRMTASHAKALAQDDLFTNHCPRVRPMQRSILHPVPLNTLLLLSSLWTSAHTTPSVQNACLPWPYPFTDTFLNKVTYEWVSSFPFFWDTLSDPSATNKAITASSLSPALGSEPCQVWAHSNLTAGVRSS